MRAQAGGGENVLGRGEVKECGERRERGLAAVPACLPHSRPTSVSRIHLHAQKLFSPPPAPSSSSFSIIITSHHYLQSLPSPATANILLPPPPSSSSPPPHRIPPPRSWSPFPPRTGQLRQLSLTLTPQLPPPLLPLKPTHLCTPTHHQHSLPHHHYYSRTPTSTTTSAITTQPHDPPRAGLPLRRLRFDALP